MDCWAQSYIYKLLGMGSKWLSFPRFLWFILDPSKEPCNPQTDLYDLFFLNLDVCPVRITYTDGNVAAYVCAGVMAAEPQSECHAEVPDFGEALAGGTDDNMHAWGIQCRNWFQISDLSANVPVCLCCLVFFKRLSFRLSPLSILSSSQLNFLPH